MPTVRLIRPHPNQARIKAEAARNNVVACGRRWGKSTLGINLACEAALPVGRRRGYPVGWFAPEYKLLREAWREFREALGPVIAKANDAERRIELVNGGIIEAWAFDRNPNAGRSRRYKRAIVDEAAHARDLKQIVARAIRPTLTDFGGDLWLLSSPNGRNDFQEFYRRGVEGRPGWRSWTQTSYDNPHLDAAEIDAARLDLDEWAFKQEYLAEFLDDASGALLKEWWVDRCADPGILATVEALRAEGQGGRRVLAADLAAGTGRDSFTCCVRDRLGVLAWEESAAVGIAEAAGVVARLARRHDVADEDVHFDAGGPGRDFPRHLEQHRVEGVPWHGGAPCKGRWSNRRTRAAWRLRRRLDPERPTPLPGPVADDGNPWAAPPRQPEPGPQPPFAIPPGVVGPGWPKLREELLALRYTLERDKVALELKDVLMARLGRSPDRADALSMTFADASEEDE